MAAIFRKVRNRQAWATADEAFTLAAAPFFDDLTPESDQLSVWRSENEPDLLMAAAALASTRDYLDKVDFVVAAENSVESIGLVIATSLGVTAYHLANALHRDLRSLTLGRLLLLADEFVRCPTRRITRTEIKAILLEAVASRHIDATDLKQSLRSQLGIAQDE